MHLVTVNDSKTGVEYTYDADLKIKTVDDGLAFFQSQLAYVDATIYKRKYREIVYPDFVMVDTSDPEWTDTYTYYHYDGVTSGKFIGSNAKDLPESDITAGQVNAPLFYGGNSFSYSLDELRKSQALRMPVDTLKGQLSFRGFQEHAQRVAFNGDSERGITGLFNNANVQVYNTTTNFATATGQEMVDALDENLLRVWNNSAQSQLANTLALPSSIWEIIYKKRMDTGTDTTVLTYFLENNLYAQKTNGGRLNVMQNLELDTAGVGGVPRMVAYEKTAETMTMRMPIPWRSIAPQPEGLRVKVPAEYKFGGVEIRFPGAFAYSDFTS